MITTSTPARWQASSAARLGQREAALGVAEERAALAEQGAVEVGVDASQCHRRGRYRSGDELAARRSGPWTWSSRWRPGSSTSPSTRCSRGRAAARRSRRSPTGWRWSRPASTCSTSAPWRRKAGRRSRPRTRPRRWCRRSKGWPGAGVPISADTFSVEVARRALEAGRGRGQRHLRRLGGDVRAGRRERLRLRADAHRGAAAGRPARRRLRRRGRPPEVLVRGESRAGPRALGSRRSRSRSTPDSTSTSAPSRTWRSCAGSASCARSACRSTSRSRARTSSAPCSPAPGRSGCRRASASGGRSPRSPWRCARGADVLRIHDRSSLQAMRVAGAIRRSSGDRSRGSTRREEPAAGRALSAWAVAIDPARRDGRIVAESSEEERSAKPVALPRSLDPGLRRGAARGPASSASTRTSARRSRRPPPRTW